VKYHYAPGSAAAHERAAALFGPARPATHLVLERAEIPIEAAPKLAADVVARGGWARSVWAIAEDVASCALVESVSVRVRLHDVTGYAMWVDGHAAGASLWRPRYARLAHEGLQVALGLIEIRYGRCERCGRPDIRLRQDGAPRAHKTAQGGKCE
jgi:hypothetical protein